MKDGKNSKVETKPTSKPRDDEKTEKKETKGTQDTFVPNAKIVEIDSQLEEIDAKRLALKEKGAKLMEQKKQLMTIDQLTLRRLASGSFSSAEMKWMEDNPEDWKKIKEATKGKVGSRKAQQVSAK